MKGLWSGKRFGVLFAVLLTAFTAYALLDVFVIPRQYALVAPDSEAVQRKEASALPQDAEAESQSDAQASESGGASGDGSSDTSHKPSRPHGRGESGSDGAFPNPWESADDGAFPNPWGNPDGAFPNPRERGRGSASDSATDETPESGVAESEVIRSYSDDNISITITQYRACNTDTYVADVTLSAPEYLKTALANNVYGRNVKGKTSAIAAENNAILAINGDYYGARNSGYVIRNGTLYRDSGAGGEVLAIFADGSFQIADDRETAAQALLDAGAVQALSFGPALVKDGAVAVTEEQEVGKAMANNPRTAIGVVDDLHYVFVVADGRTARSEGMSLHELAEFMRGLGVETAYNLDGGGSSTMVFNGEIINNPTTNGNSVQERSVSDIVYIGA